MTAPRAEDALLEVRGLHRFYFTGGEGEVAALKDVSFDVVPGELVALVGPSGSGKSTLLNLIAGLDNPDGGNIWTAGHRISHRNPAEQSVLRGCLVGVLTQSSALMDHLSVEANVALAADLRRRARRSRRGKELGVSTSADSRTEMDDDLLEELGLADRRKARPSTLSGGETARANLAVALAGTPALILADEPTAEVSRGEERAVLDALSEHRPRGGATVVVTHSPAVAAVADRVLELEFGRLR
ncbi:MAG TPA: ABC transporter ATP-binding protein [Acidimicrobiales bacterium]|nr:ABC transporter ATP-binding protein [Acidimicrobiales bacterium]